MKSDRQPGAPVGLTPNEGSGLLDIRSMSKTVQEAAERDKKKVDLSGLPNDFAPAALGGSVLLPVPVKRSNGALKIVAIFLGSVIGLAGLIVGLLFVVGVLPPQEEPPPVAIAQVISPPPASTPASTPATTPVAEVEDEEEPQKGKTTKNTKSSKTAKNTKTTKTETKTDNTSSKRKNNTREADELLGILGK